jgi:predicted nucleic acid-binding protein
MSPCFIDTNLFIRYFTNDDPRKADRVQSLLNKAAAGKIRLVTAEIVLAEIVWVMESCYEVERPRIADILKAILATPGLEIINGKVVEKAVEYYLQHNIDFIDAYIVALMDKLNITGIYSFDKKHLDRITAIERNEP